MSALRIIAGAWMVASVGCGGAPSRTPTGPAAAGSSPNSPGSTCTFALDVGSTTFDAVGGSAPASVTAAAGCRWTIDASAPPWIQTQSRGPFNGAATFTITIDPNRSFDARSGTLTIADERGQDVAGSTLVQRAAGCLYTVDPASVPIDARGSYYPVEEPGVPTPVHVHAEPAECRWTATPSAPWLQLVYWSATSGTGDGVVHLLIEPNSQAASRSGELVVSGLSGLNPSARVVVKQSGR